MALKIAPADSGAQSIGGLSPRRGALRQLWRLGAWGGAAAVALVAVAFVSRTQVGEQRIQLALANASESGRAGVVAALPPRSQASTPASDAETQRLAEAVRKLTADRDRLMARIASLERNIDDMTGSIKAAAQANEAAASVKPPVAETTAAPVVSAPKSVESKTAESKTVESKSVEPNPVEPKPLEPMSAAEPMAFPPGPHAAAALAPAPFEPVLVPLPPVRIAMAQPSEAAMPAEPFKPEFGIDLGTGATLDALRAHWAAVKANFGPLLVGLRPLASPRKLRAGGTDYRLVAGPVQDVAAAVRLCARFAGGRTACRPARFDGEQLAVQ
jgi:hypothetical protein